MLKKVFAVGVSIMMVALALIGCGKGNNAPAADVNKEKEMTIGLGRDFYQGPTTSIFLHGSTNVYESLTRFNDNMNVEMELAESMVQDGVTWTVKLKKDVKFHDGTTLNADAAIKNIDRLYHFSTGKKAYDKEFSNKDEFGDIVDMKKVDDLTFTVTHAKPIPDFDARVAYGNGAMFAPSSFDENNAIQKPIGTGPFMFKEYDETNKILTLEKFNDYRLGAPKISKIVFRSITDPAARLAALESGEIDVIADVGGVLPQQAESIKNNNKLVLKEKLVSTTHYMFVNASEGKIFSDVKLRNMLSMSIDRNAVVSKLLRGYGKEATSVLSSANVPFVVDCGYKYDMTEAAKLKNEAAQGKEIKPVILLNSSITGRWPYKEVATALQAELKNIGVEAVIEEVDAATWTSRLKAGDYDIAPQPFTVSSGEPNFFFTRNVLSTGANNKSRNYGINNAELDALINEVAVEPNKEKRVELYQKIQKIIRENDYIIPVWNDVTLYALNNKVKDFEIDVTFKPDLFKADID